MNPYYDDYRKYKRLYLDLKKQQNQNQRGGDLSQDLYQRFNLKNYEVYINKLRALATCEKDYTDTNELKADLKGIYETLVSLGMKDFSQKEELDSLSQADLLRIRNNICTTIRNDIIPILEKEKNLANKFVQDFRTYAANIDISPYIEYAKKQNLFGLSVSEILESYGQDLERKQTELRSLRDTLKSKTGTYAATASQRAEELRTQAQPYAATASQRAQELRMQVQPYVAAASQKAQELKVQAQPYVAAAATYATQLKEKYIQPTQCSPPCMEQQTLFGKRCRCPQQGLFGKQ